MTDRWRRVALITVAVILLAASGGCGVPFGIAVSKSVEKPAPEPIDEEVGPPADPEELKRLLARAETGDPEASLKLGLAAADGNEALSWLCQAARAGNGTAMMQIGIFYQSGKEPLPLNYIAAYKWYVLALAHRERLAERFRRQIVSTMDPWEISAAERSADEWNPESGCP